ncbi:MAG: TIGR04211 family SH3 domain-containing protein [Gammaproteobacteria bacterium]
MMRRPLTAAVLALAWCAAASAAPTAYVIDKLLVGVHEDRDLNSAIVKVLPTGTKLDVLQREGELAEVRDGDGTVGWVDGAYLMEEAPAQLQVQTLSEENAELKRRLAATPTSDVTAPDTGRDKLTQENTELKGKLSAEKLKVGKLETKMSALEAKVAERPLTPADTVIAELEQKNQELAREFEAAMQTTKRLESQLDSNALPAIPLAVGAVSRSLWIAALVAVLFAFGAGVYTMDYLNRRRHGGFRI